MAKILVLLVISLACVLLNAEEYTAHERFDFGQTFDEIVVSSDLNIRRKSKENRQGKKLLSGVPSGTTGPPEKLIPTAFRLISIDGSHIDLEKRGKRWISASDKRYLDLGFAEYLLKSRKR
ncbi:uncharacterized protein [Prorops nasuta]|uniref:uncharacterized protein n=1 Tax=Prorops nasuta TaxID=863751 RepID=UPI0034CE5C2B